jgi:hypothetical protein
MVVKEALTLRKVLDEICSCHPATQYIKPEITVSQHKKLILTPVIRK